MINAQAASRWLSHQPPNLEKARESLDGIAQNTARARDIIAGIRELFSKESQQREPFDINEAIREVITLTKGEARKYGISVVMSLDEALPHLEGDRIQLQQVILNLINNAMQAMSTGASDPRELQIFTGKSDHGDIVVAVRDSGPGLDPENPERVFETFYTTKPDGLGIGLSICRSIIEAQGGQLTAGANKPRGAAFQFTLPVHGQGPAQK
jgi:C4-dicarboxylate-specific signal transduction histidine kinase